MKQIVIYPGRFQPMLSHHAEVYDRLQAKFPNAEVYIGTSDKVDGDKSPFNFKEKQIIAQGHGIDSNNVKFARSPYVNTFYDSIENQDNVTVIFAVGEKDKERFTFDNIDEKTGLNMKQNGEPYYYQMINTYNEDNPVPMTKRGYIYNVPNIESDDEEIASASAFRNALKTAPDEQSAKEIFSKQFKNYNESLFNLIYNKIAGNKMNEDLNLLRQLAGLDVSEDAPVEFETPLSIKDIKFTPPSKSSAFMSIANRFPEDVDVNDPEVKKDEFIKVLLKAPLSLLSEINERISPADDNGLAISTKLSAVIDNLGRDGDLKDLSDEDRAFSIKIVKLAIDKMELRAGDDTPKYDDMEDEKETDESLDLSDIRNDYGIEEDDVQEGKMSDIHQAANEMSKEEFAKEHPEFADDWEGMQNDPDAEDEPRDDGTPAYKKYIGKNKKDESLEEAEATIEDCIRKTLEKEGGAAGLGAIEDACKEAGFEENCEDAISKMSDVKKHEHGDYILEAKNCGCGQTPCKTYGSVEEGKLPAGLQAYQDKKKGKKGKKDDDKEVEEDKKEVEETLNDLRKRAGLEEVNERSECHSKDHDCATKVIHPKWGEGKPMYESHAIPTNEGYVAWYDVEFAHGIEKEVPAQDMEIITLAEHGSLKASKFKPHMMYDPKTGEGKMAKVEQDHLDMKAKGWGHEKPEVEESRLEVRAVSEEEVSSTVYDMEDEELMDYVGQKQEDIIDDIQQHIAPDFLYKDNYDEMFMRYREEVLEPAAQELSQDKAMDQMPDEMEMDTEESIESTSNNAFEAAMGELKKLAGL